MTLTVAKCKMEQTLLKNNWSICGMNRLCLSQGIRLEELRKAKRDLGTICGLAEKGAVHLPSSIPIDILQYISSLVSIASRSTQRTQSALTKSGWLGRLYSLVTEFNCIGTINRQFCRIGRRRPGEERVGNIPA
jgi:hypothetical protein